MVPPRGPIRTSGERSRSGLTPAGSSLTRPAGRRAGATSARRSSATRPQVGIEVPAQHVAQDRAQARAERRDERLDRRLRAHEARHDGALHRDRPAQPGDELVALARHRADRRHPLAQPLVADRVGLGEQRAGGQQPVRERLQRRAALAAQLEAPQRPRELARARRPARDERAERAQRVLLLGREQAVAGRAAQAGGERDREPGRAVGPRPRRRPERRLGVVPQPQRGLQPAQPAARLLEARAFTSCPAPSASTATVANSSPRSSGGTSRSATPRTSASPSPSGTSSDSITRPSTGVTTSESAQPA